MKNICFNTHTTWAKIRLNETSTSNENKNLKCVQHENLCARLFSIFFFFHFVVYPFDVYCGIDTTLNKYNTLTTSFDGTPIYATLCDEHNLNFSTLFRLLLIQLSIKYNLPSMHKTN